MNKRRVSWLFACVSAPVLSSAGWAQEAPAAAVPNAGPTPQTSSTIAEVVVTANKRSENVQKVPISIDSITAQALAQTGVTTTSDLAQAVAGLTLQSSFNGLQPHIRGIGTTAISSGNESSVATYLDGVYIAAMSGAMMELANIEQVDVLKGPQGTLFGRNATGGLVMVRTKDPSHDFHMNASLTYGNYNTGSGSLYVTNGITDNVAADLSLYGLYQGEGYGTNLRTGTEVYKSREYAARTKWLFTPNDSTKIRLALDSSETNNNGLATYTELPSIPLSIGPGPTLASQRPDLAPYVAAGALPGNLPVGQPSYNTPSNPWDINNYYDPKWLFRDRGASLQIDEDFDFARLTSITAYRETRKSTYYGVTPTPINFEGAGWNDLGRQTSQEVQLASRPSSPISWVAGLYYLNARIGYQPFIINGASLAPLQQLSFEDKQTTDAGAAYGQATVPIFDSTHLTVGLRYSVERKSIVGDTLLEFLPPLQSLDAATGLTNAHKTWDKLTYRFALDHQFTDNILGYVSYNTGFKSGVYQTIPPGGPNAQPVNPETLDAYEMGVKSDLFDRRLRLNVAALLYNYREIQVNVFNNTTALTINGARAQIYGLDLDMIAKPVENLTVNFGTELIHDRFQSFPNGQVINPVPLADGGGTVYSSGNLAGKRIPFTPDATIKFGVDYVVPMSVGDFTLSLSYSYNNGWYFSPDNSVGQGAYSLLNSQVTWALPDHHTEVSIWGKNLTNKDYATFFITAANPGGFEERTLGPPRTFGITLRYRT
jgi:iron complex outermembrane recepter protein